MNKKLLVMLIDDNRIDLFIHHEFIKQMNIAHSVLEYQSASDALDYLIKNDYDKWPEVILLDIHMPIMNGFEFLIKYSTLPILLREKTNIVIVSSSLDTGDVVKAKDSSLVLELLEKPLNTEKLRALLIANNII
jgi:CheY-like chemotaxis protein